MGVVASNTGDAKCRNVGLAQVDRSSGKPGSELPLAGLQRRGFTQSRFAACQSGQSYGGR